MLETLNLPLTYNHTGFSMLKLGRIMIIGQGNPVEMQKPDYIIKITFLSKNTSPDIRMQVYTGIL